MRAMLFTLAGVSVLSSLSGCGETVPEQALFGAGSGAATAAILDGSIATGAVVGAAGNVAYCQLYPGRCN